MARRNKACLDNLRKAFLNKHSVVYLDNLKLICLDRPKKTSKDNKRKAFLGQTKTICKDKHKAAYLERKHPLVQLFSELKYKLALVLKQARKKNDKLIQT